MPVPIRRLLRDLERDVRRGVPTRKGKPNRTPKNEAEFLGFMIMWAEKRGKEIDLKARETEKAAADAEKSASDTQT